MPPPIVAHISDTARWVASYRAAETKRPDALFRDPFAERLAGARGFEIAAKLPKTMRRNTWPMVMRTKTIDDLVMAAVRRGADRVLNLAAGFDARPYRLDLPASLTWIEADLPAVLDEKERALAGEAPRCRLVRERVDLSDPGQRSALLDRACSDPPASTAEASAPVQVVVITEGLLIYLADDVVRALARELASRRAVQSWILDLVSPVVLGMIRRQVNHRLSPDAEMRFAPPDGVSFFAPLGWKATDVRSLLREASRAERLPLLLKPLALFPDPDPANPGNRPWSAVVELARA